MTNKLTALEVDAQTGIITERELTADEIAERKEITAQQEQQLAEAEAKVAARQSALAKLAKLGLTQAEIDAL
jgi:hypothetical protein